MDNPFLNAQAQLDKVGKILGLDENILNSLKWPDRVLKFHVPVKMDDGSIKVFEGFRSQHNNARGPYKGGVRFHPNVSEDEVKALSTWMTWKCAVAGIPYGGGKGGIVVNPSELSANELEKLSRGFIQKISPIIGPDTDIPAPDMNTDGRIMGWFVDEFNKINGKELNATFTGKPLAIGGSKGRDKATGLGAVFALEAMTKQFKLVPEKTSIAVQGIGNVGYWFAKLAYDRGYKIVAISDSKGGVYEERGLNPQEALEFKKKNGTLKGFAEEITNEKLLELSVDIIVPAALENVITKENADRIKAKYIIEAANGPVTPEADKVLFEKGITSVPDVLANSGGVTVSYFEWVQNRMGYYWSEKEVDEKLEVIMKDAFEASYNLMKKYDVDMRMGAYVLAVERVVEAMKIRGRI